MEHSMLPGAGRNESLHRAFEVLDAVAGTKSGVSTAAIAAETKLPRSTVSRLLASLFDVGAVARPADRKWVLGPTILRLSAAVSPFASLLKDSHEVLSEISRELGETSMLAVSTGPLSARVVDEVEGTRLVGVRPQWVGRTMDSPASGFVRTLLADLPAEQLPEILRAMPVIRHTPKTKVGIDELILEIERIRTNQHSSVVDELEEGLSGVGYPIRRDGQIVAQLAVYFPTARLTSEMHEHAITVLRTAAERLERSATE